MAIYSRIPLSGSTDGRPIKVVATAIGSGTTIHTATSDATLPDNITLFAFNSDTVSRVLTIGWGGTTSPDDLIKYTIPSQSGWMLVASNQVLRNSLIVKAAADAANVVTIQGHVNRIS